MKNLAEKLAPSTRLVGSIETFKLKEKVEEGVLQIKALLGLENLITNVGQIPNLPLGALIKTNAIFRANRVEPIGM